MRLAKADDLVPAQGLAGEPAGRARAERREAVDEIALERSAPVSESTPEKRHFEEPAGVERAPEERRRSLHFAVLSGPAPLLDWQRAALALLEDTDGVYRESAVPGGEQAGAASAGRLDFILSFASESAGRELARTARLGVWQFCFGEWTLCRGASQGFWEIAGGLETASASLVQLQDDPDTVRVLVRARIRSHACLPSASRSQLERLVTHFPRQVCLALLDAPTRELRGELVRASSRAPRRPTARSWLAFAARAPLRFVRNQLEQLAHHEHWNVGIVDAPIDSLLDATRPLEPRWLRAPGHREFFADPFAIARDGRRFVFCEHFDYRTGSGRIVAFDVDAPQAPSQTVEIGPSVHRSYPYLLQHEGRLFCIPETCATNEVVLYEVERFPDRWRRVAVLISGLPLIDVTPFRYEGRWWLSASLPVSRGANYELRLYFADALEGPWQAHPGNPVKVDVGSARPGGTPFWKDGSLYRPAQDCTRRYGRRVVINRVLTLTERSFEEEFAAAVEPPSSGRYTEGLHTISALGEATIIDAKRHAIVLEETLRVIALGLKKRLARSRARR